MDVKKFIIITVLLALAALLTWFVWIETKVLLITLALLAVCLGALYLVVRKM